MNCKHCSEEIKRDADGDWIDRETGTCCQGRGSGRQGSKRKHEPGIPKERTREEIARDYYLASGRGNSAPSKETLNRIDAQEKLDKIADVVLSYRPKSKQPKPRKRKKAKRPKRA